MARLRQQNPFNYMTSEKINAEFENIVRYINSAELGDKTLSELLDVLFDPLTGEFDGPIEFMFDGSVGLQYRVGEYSDPTAGWVVIATPDEIRGAPGMDLGMIEGPLYYNRQDSVPNNGVTVVAYPGIDSATDDILVYLNGLLQPKVGVYNVDFTTKNVTFLTPFNGTMKLTMYCVRSAVSVAYVRSDQSAASGQTVFAFPNAPGDSILVYRNGILQQQGGAADYVVDPTADVIVFNSPTIAGDKMSFIIADNPSVTRVGGLMTTAVYAPTGLIPYSLLLVNDNQIPANKVNGLTLYLANGVVMVVSPTTPTSPNTKTLWINTSKSPNQLNFYDGATWISTSPESEVPPFDVTNANEYLRVNATGSAFEYGNIDFSSLIPKSQKGQANGVATLDASGFVPDGQIGPQRSYVSVPFQTVAIGTTTGLIFTGRFFMQAIRIEGISLVLSTGGTCDAQIAIDGSVVGPVFHLTTTKQDVVLSPMIQVDATTVSHEIGIWITNPVTSPGILRGCFSISTLVAE
jgi:hypothetical protein